MLKISCPKWKNLPRRCSTNLWENDKGFSFERNCVLRRWESEALKQIINYKVRNVN